MAESLSKPRAGRDTLIAALVTIALIGTSVWVVKILGPRALNPDYFCNCSVIEGNFVLLAWPVAAIACLVVALRLRHSKGVNRTAGIVAGISAILLPIVTVLVIAYVPFPTIEELHGWKMQSALRALPTFCPQLS